MSSRKYDGRNVFILLFFLMKTLFLESLSRNLLDYGGFRDMIYYHVQTTRIRLVNSDKMCANKSFYGDEAVLQFYISNSTVDLGHTNDTDKPMTIKAFKILHGYWNNHLMIMLHKVFQKQVSKVELYEDCKEKSVEELTETQRIGIGIGVALAVVVLVIIIYFCVTTRRQVCSVGSKPRDNRMVFTNTVAIKEEATSGSSEAALNAGNAGQPESDSKGIDEPEEVVIHQEPRTQDKTPLLSAVKDYEEGQKVAQKGAPLAQPEPDNVSEGEPLEPPEEPKEEPVTSPEEPEGEPIKLPEEPEREPIKSPEEPEGEQIKSPEEPEAEPVKSVDEGEGEPSQSPDDPEVVVAPEEAPPPTESPALFTSAVTVMITPEDSPEKTETLVPKSPPDPPKEEDDKPASQGEDEDSKPDFGQSDTKDEDPTEGAINLGFDDRHDESGNGKDKEDEEVNSKTHADRRSWNSDLNADIFEPLTTEESETVLFPGD